MGELRKNNEGLHIHSFVGMTGRWVDDKLIFKNRNFTATDYYSNTYMMSLTHRYWYFMTIGTRGKGKTFSGKKGSIKWIKKQVEQIMEDFVKGDVSNIRRFMWWRLTNDAVLKVTENNGATFFEQKLLRKYKISVKIVASDIYFALDGDYTVDIKWIDDDEESHREVMHIKDANYYLEQNSAELVGDKKINWIHVGKIAAIQEYFKYKGNQFEEYDRIIMDELVRAKSERRTFDIPSAFINMIENIARTREGVRVFIYANAIGEMQEVKQLFGFMPLPGRFGIYKLYHKRAVIEYLDDSKEWKDKQSKTMAGVLRGKASEFTNVHEDPLDDKEDFFIARKFVKGKRYFMSLKIKRGLWLDIHSYKGIYYVDTDNYTSKKMAKQNKFALGRDLVTANTTYSKEYIKFIKEMWELGRFRFSSPICYEWFTKALDKYNII